jgi:hypothetical protein
LRIRRLHAQVPEPTVDCRALNKGAHPCVSMVGEKLTDPMLG